MRKYLLYFLFLFYVIFSTSCKKNSLKAPPASFVVINSLSVKPKTNPNQGSSSHKITDIWYYVNDEFKGIFPIGSVMPVLGTGEQKITLFAGIKNNGISDTRVPYEFYNPVIYNLNMEVGKTYTLSPEFEYKPNTVFVYVNNFDGAGNNFDSVGDSAVSNTNTFDVTKSFGGNGGSIFMGMSDAKPTAQIINSINWLLPIGGATIYLELDYNCNQSITVGVLGGSGSNVSQRDALVLNSTGGVWNKVYIPLTSSVSTPPTYEFVGYRVFIRANKEVNQPQIYLDNIKLIY